MKDLFALAVESKRTQQEWQNINVKGLEFYSSLIYVSQGFIISGFHSLSPDPSICQCCRQPLCLYTHVFL